MSYWQGAGNSRREILTQKRKAQGVTTMTEEQSIVPTNGYQADVFQAPQRTIEMMVKQAKRIPMRLKMSDEGFRFDGSRETVPEVVGMVTFVGACLIRFRDGTSERLSMVDDLDEGPEGFEPRATIRIMTEAGLYLELETPKFSYFRWLEYLKLLDAQGFDVFKVPLRVQVETIKRKQGAFNAMVFSSPAQQQPEAPKEREAEASPASKIDDDALPF
jgi:hypothetical protein